MPGLRGSIMAEEEEDSVNEFGEKSLTMDVGGSCSGS